MVKTPIDDGSLQGRYLRLRDEGIEAIEQGRLQDASALYAEALDLARRGDETLVDIAFCNWAAVRISLHETDGLLASLRKILMRSNDPAHCRLAAYNISRIYEDRGEPKKGLFYARIARDRTSQLDEADPSWVASDHNQIGNFLVADSRFEEALEEYDLALAVQPQGQRDRVAALKLNAGYCHLMLGRTETAFRLLYASLRVLSKFGLTRNLGLNHLDLGYAYLEIGRPRPALRHCRRSLAMAKQLKDESQIKNALYLLGEACHLNGDDDSARRVFEELSERYNDIPFVADFLLSVDVRRMINLRA